MNRLFNKSPSYLIALSLSVIIVIIIVILIFRSFSEEGVKLTYSDLLQLTDNDFIIVNIGNTKIKAEIARSKEKKAKGLSGKDNLKDNEGMFFVFEREGNYGFWMKEMKFNIDIIFIKNDTVVDIAKNMPYSTNEDNIAGVSPKEKANLVLEIGAGLAEKYNIKTGSKAAFYK